MLKTIKWKRKLSNGRFLKLIAIFRKNIFFNAAYEILLLAVLDTVFSIFLVITVELLLLQVFRYSLQNEMQRQMNIGSHLKSQYPNSIVVSMDSVVM